MKSIFHTMAAAALLGCLTFSASAVDTGKAVAAQFHVAGSNKPSEFETVATPGASKKGGMFGNFEPIGNSEYQWQVLNIPVRVGAGKVAVNGGDKVIPNYVPEITFHVYVRVETTVTDKKGKASKGYVTLDKEITYVNIPLKKANGNVTVGTASVDAYADMQVAVFLSPSDVVRLSENEANPDYSLGGKTQPKIKVVAVAMEASYKGVSCWRTAKNEKTPYLAIDSSACSNLSDNWWKRSSGSTKGASLSCISETPFASEYYPYYCATKPLYGAPTPSAPSSPAPMPAPEAADDSTPVTPATADEPADGDAADDDATGADDSADSGDSRRGGKRKTKTGKRK